MARDGLLIVDKPAGPTSHDVVARVRRVAGERAGHTGTLDPLASGVLPLVIGRATRLARFLETDDKEYQAVIRIGQATDTHDEVGQPIGPRHGGPLPSLDAIERALDAFRGTFLQQPPAFSAKRIGGKRSYRLARSRARAAMQPAAVIDPAPPELPAPATVSANALTVTGLDGDRLSLTIACSGGFYVRSLAHDLGCALGVGAHLAELRRTRASGFGLADALPLAVIEDPSAGSAALDRALLSPAAMLGALAAVRLDEDGVRRVARGMEVETGDPIVTGYVRLLDPNGTLLAVAQPAGAPGVLHPVVVLM